MNPYELQRYISIYNQNPYYFNDNQLDEIEQASKEYGVPFQRNMDAEESKQDNLLSQFFSGMVEGFTTLGWEEEPTSEAGQIINSVGHLIGFAPAIVSGPLGLGARQVAKYGTGRVVRGVSKSLQTASNLAKTQSVPFQVAEKIINKPLYKGLTKAGINVDEYVKKGSVTADVLMSAQNLGVASAISSVWEGTDAMMDSYVHGAIAGGAFGAIGNFVNIGNNLNHSNPVVQQTAKSYLKRQVDKVNWTKVARAGAGSLFQGGLATMNEAPTSVQIYEYLLGGFFGYKHVNAKEKVAHQYLQKFGPKGEYSKDRFKMTELEEFQTLPKEAQDYVRKYWYDDIGQLYNQYAPKEEVAPNVQEPSIAGLVLKEAVYKKEKAKVTKKDKSISPEDETLAKIRTMEEVELMAQEGRVEKEVIREIFKDSSLANIKGRKITDKDFKRFVKDGFVPDDILKGIANKIIRGNEGFTERELAIQIEHSARIEAMLVSEQRMSPQAKAIYNKLTPEQVKTLRKGEDINLLRDIIDGGRDRTIDIKEWRDLQNLERPIEDQLELEIPYQIKDLVSEVQKNSRTPVEQTDVLQRIVEKWNGIK